MESRWRVGIRVTTVHLIDLRSDIYYVLLCFILFVCFYRYVELSNCPFFLWNSSDPKGKF